MASETLEASQHRQGPLLESFLTVGMSNLTFQETTPFGSLAMSPAQTHTLRACSFLVIPPPPDRIPTQGSFPTDLSELNLSGWATLVQDVAAGLQVLPPNLG